MEGIAIKEVKKEQTEGRLPEAEAFDMEPAEDEQTFPVWMKSIGEDKYEVHTRRRKYILEDVEYSKIMSAKQRTTGGKSTPAAMDNFEIALIAVSMFQPKLTELEIRQLKGSEFMRLRAAIYKLYDIESFLSM